MHFRAIDQAGDICVGDQIRREQEVFLERGRGSGAAVDSVESSECGRTPHDEAAEVSTWCELKEIEREHGAGLNTGDVAECANQVLAVGFGVVDDERSTALAVAATSQFSFTGSELAGSLDFADVWSGTDGFEKGESCGGLGDGGSFEGGG